MDIQKLQQRCRSRSLNCCHVSLKSFKTTSNVSHRWTKQPSLKELTAVSHTQLFITSLSCAIWLHWWETNLVAGQRALTWARAQRRSKDQHPSIHHSEILQQWWLYFRDARSWESVSLRDELPVGTYCIGSNPTTFTHISSLNHRLDKENRKMCVSRFPEHPPQQLVGGMAARCH